MQFSEKKTYILSNNLFKISMLQQVLNFPCSVELSSFLRFKHLLIMR